MNAPWTSLIPTFVKAIGLALLLLPASALTGFAQSADGGPAVRIPQPVFTFQPVIEGTDVHHDFMVLNTGTAPLKIERVATS